MVHNECAGEYACVSTASRSIRIKRVCMEGGGMQERERMLQSCVLVGLRKNRCSAGGCRPTDGHAVRHAQLVCRERKYCLIHVQAASTLASFCDTLEPRSPIDKPGSVCAWAWVHHMHIPSRYAPIHRAYEHKHVISKGSQKKKNGWPGQDMHRPMRAMQSLLAQHQHPLLPRVARTRVT